MALDQLLARLERRAVTPVTPDSKPDVTPKPASILACTPVTSVTLVRNTHVTAENDDRAGAAAKEVADEVKTIALASDVLPDPKAEARRQRVLQMLRDNPRIQYALVTDTEADPEAVILALAIRSRATCEVAIPRAKYDPWLLLELIEKHGGSLH